MYVLKSICIAVALFLLTPFNSIGATDSVSIYGYWLNEAQNTIVQIYTSQGEVFGKVVWLENSGNSNESPKLDVMNKDVTLRHRPILGINVLSRFTYKKGAWRHGKVYNYKNGHSYNAKLRIDNEGNLQWTGYYGILVFLSKTKKWIPINDMSKFDQK